MDPVSIIVGALVSGAAAAAKQTGNLAITDAYQGLKKLFINSWKKATNDESKASFLVEGLEKNPEAIESYVRSEIEAAMPKLDPELIKLAENLSKLIEGNEQAPKFVSEIKNSQGVIVGDNASQSNDFSKSK